MTYSGVPPTSPASYQGVVYLFVAGQEIVPYAFVNLKVGGQAGGRPESSSIGGTPIEYAFFPGLPAGARRRDAPPLTVDVRNPGTSPMELAAEIGPEVWLVPSRGWNADADPARRHPDRRASRRGGPRPAGSALPALHLLHGPDEGRRHGAPPRPGQRPARSGPQAALALPPGVRSYVVPSVVNATSKIGNTFVSRLRLSNAGPTPSRPSSSTRPRDADGFDADAVAAPQSSSRPTTSSP